MLATDEQGGENGSQFYMECCQIVDGIEQGCYEWYNGVDFPQDNCSFVGMALGKHLILCIGIDI